MTIDLKLGAVMIYISMRILLSSNLIIRKRS